jgi:hypothetical protein
MFIIEKLTVSRNGTVSGIIHLNIFFFIINLKNKDIVYQYILYSVKLAKVEFDEDNLDIQLDTCAIQNLPPNLSLDISIDKKMG